MNENLTATQTAKVPVEVPLSSPLKVLVIEDNSLDTRLIQIMLHEAGGGQFDLQQTERLARDHRRRGGGFVTPR